VVSDRDAEVFDCDLDLIVSPLSCRRMLVISPRSKQILVSVHGNDFVVP
jgi:hypothetical protein